MEALRLLPVEAAEGAVRVDALYLGLCALAFVIVLLVAGLIIVFCVRYRRSSGAALKPLPAILSKEIEIGWTAATFFAFLFIFWWAAAQNLSALKGPSDPLRIHVVAKQWMWKAEHADGVREIDALHVPTGRNVLLTMNAQDVIHSFYVPAFRIKRDVVPGRTEQLEFKPTRPGAYHLLCAEFCGSSHSRMTGTITVMAPEDYARWASSSSQRTGGLAQAGKRLFRAYGCSGCHEGESKTRAPDLHGLFGSPVPLADGRVVTADAKYIRDSILFPGQDVAAGYEPAMPSFKGRINDGEMLRILAYVKSLGQAKREKGP